MIVNPQAVQYGKYTNKALSNLTADEVVELAESYSDNTAVDCFNSNVL